jgi:hypothetical protein
MDIQYLVIEKTLKRSGEKIGPIAARNLRKRRIKRKSRKKLKGTLGVDKSAHAADDVYRVVNQKNSDD